ncbi:MAG: hypothetical protein QM610_00045 [Chitinophagaceae bacterium]
MRRKITKKNWVNGHPKRTWTAPMRQAKEILDKEFKEVHRILPIKQKT